MPTWLSVLLAFWPLWAALIVTAVAWTVDHRRDETWDAPSTLPANLSEGRTR